MVYRNNFDLSVYFVADPAVCGGRAIEDVVYTAIRGGVTMVQLRNKRDSADIIREQARVVHSILADYRVPFLINDHVEIAAEVGADGVHIGQGDMSPAQAREIIGDDKVLGLTAYTRAHYDVVDTSIVDYLGTGPFFPTLTKPDKPVLGADGFAELIADVSLPVVGIGGITPENAGEVIDAGANGVAMMRGVSEAPDPSIAARKFMFAVARARKLQEACS